jgi:hypothetical protein
MRCFPGWTVMRDFRSDIVGQLLFTFGRRTALEFRAGRQLAADSGTEPQASNFSRCGQLLGTDLS